jgi:hypothetical protein
MLRPAVCTSTVAWPIQVTSISRPSTRRGGTVGVTGTCSGHCDRSLEPMIRLRKRAVPPWAAAGPGPGLKKRPPSKWPERGPS